MIGGSLLSFILFWGIWLLVPIFIDGSSAVSQLLGAWKAEREKRRAGWRTHQLKVFPRVTIVVPVRNGSVTLGPAIESLRRQSYPTHQLEVIVVDNGSTDATNQVAREQQRRNTIGALHCIVVPSRGKANALNIGIYHAKGEYIANLDADVELHPDAILNMVRAFEAAPTLAAATGAIEIAPDDGEEKSAARRLLQECEFIEYLASFRVGRQHQSAMNGLYTLAGAFSFFRQDVLLRLPQYSNRTVSEDTDITFSLHEQFPHLRAACIPEAIAYVQPTPGLAALYSQRVRWQRGELEVSALHMKSVRHGLFRLGGFSPLRTLVIDHSLAFPRLVWTFLLPMLFLLGYPLPMVVTACLVMYGFYMAVDAVTMAACYALSPSSAASPRALSTRKRLLRNWWFFAITPAYRFTLFWMRFGGFLTVITEPPEWHSSSPWREAGKHGGRLLYQALYFLTSTFTRHIW